jgi:deoxyribodipyrimidine photo-lyase
MDEFKNRVTLLKAGIENEGPVVYWMSRDQRVHDNYALLYAQKLALERKSPFGVVFNLVPDFLSASFRQYDFMLKGLEQVEKELKEFNIPFFLLSGNPSKELPGFIKTHNVSMLVTDFDPLRIKRKWKKEIGDKIQIPFYEVDAHNIVPCRYVSDKQEFAAYTLRPKIHKHLPEFLTEFPAVTKMKSTEALSADPVEWENVYKSINVDMNVRPVEWIKPGEHSAHETLKEFLEIKFDNYAADRNDPVKNAQSGLSPYLHFGQISAQRIALEVKKSGGNPDSEEAFLEELIVRRELSDNFCFYNHDYDSFTGFPGWAKETLKQHKNDAREYVYTTEQFEKAVTHEDLWNAAQNELAATGKMHGYMRMYWAKKILEWSASPEEALKIAIYLNDKYELDGRDPNGYTGCAWSIGGVHDRAWTEREIFGKIRYMNRNGAKRKFDIDAYIQKNSRRPNLF